MKSKAVRIVIPTKEIISHINPYNSEYNENQIAIKSPLVNTIQIAAQTNSKHDKNGCRQCDKVAESYLNSLRYVREREPIQCTSELFDLVWQVTHLILAHREVYLTGFETLTQELWDFAKQLKDESWECDLHPTQVQLVQPVDSLEEENYRRAIRIVIYSCRGLVFEQANDLEKAMTYYRKCVCVRSTPFETQLQQSAMVSLERLSKISGQISTSYSSSFSSTRSSSSSSSVTIASCAQCGLEKPRMPVCSRCKSQYYCSVKCLKSHQPVHSQICQ